jgi:TPR repeat protein
MFTLLLRVREIGATILLVLAGLLQAGSFSTAADAKVVEVIGKTAKVTAAPGAVQAGDRVEIFTIIPDLDEVATVATGRVPDVGDGFMLVTIDRANGKVAPDQQVRILPPAAQAKPGTAPALAAASTVTKQTAVEIEPAASGPGWLGVAVRPVSEAMANEMKLPRPVGCRLVGIYAGSPAEKSGLRPGDVVLKINDDWIHNVDLLMPALIKFKEGERPTFVLMRDGQALQVQIELAARPADSYFAKLVRERAEKDQAWAQLELCIDYHLGRGVAPDEAKALFWARKAAAQGDAYAQNFIGYAFSMGHGVAQDDAEARTWLLKAAKQGGPRAQVQLADMYRRGEGGDQDLAVSLAWYRKAAEQGNPLGQFWLGIMHLKGEGIDRDPRTAAEWFLQAANQGYSAAQREVGHLLEIGDGLPRDLEKAVKYYRLAAVQNFTPAKVDLGRLHRTGIGLPKNDVEAVKLFRSAAEQGDLRGQVQLGLAYLDGAGVEQDEQQAAKWFHKAGSAAGRQPVLLDDFLLHRIGGSGDRFAVAVEPCETCRFEEMDFRIGTDHIRRLFQSVKSCGPQFCGSPRGSGIFDVVRLVQQRLAAADVGRNVLRLQGDAGVE